MDEALKNEACMKTGDPRFHDVLEKSPTSVLQAFVELFASKGWLNQTLRIKHRGRRYRIGCSEAKFLAYRINDHCGISPGFPGWTVCMVTRDQVMEDTQMGAFVSGEPTVRDWLRCMAEADFELL